MSLQIITSLSRSLTEWAGRAGNEKFLRTDQETRLAESLGDAQKRPHVQVAAWMLGTWHLGHGMVQALQGNVRGFDEARVGQALRRCSLLLRDRHRAPVRRGQPAVLPFSLLHGSWTSLLALALEDPGAEDLHELLRTLPDSAFGENDHLALFVRELLNLRSGQRPLITPRLGPYEPVLLGWTGEPRIFAQRLADVLDLHLDQARGAGRPFEDPACQLYPVEAIAVHKVRELLGLPRPKVEHALMFTNLAQMQPIGAWPQHEMVTRLERLLRSR